jgi:hypothetical protein
MPFVLETPFYFDSDRSASRGRYIKINIANENLTSPVYCVKFVLFFHVSITYHTSKVSYLGRTLQETRFKLLSIYTRGCNRTLNNTPRVHA